MNNERTYHQKQSFSGNLRMFQNDFMLELKATWFKNNINIYLFFRWVAFGIVIVSMIVMACCGEIRRQTPWNFIFLAIFTLAQSLLLGLVSSIHAPEAVSTNPLLLLLLLEFQNRIIDIRDSRNKRSLGNLNDRPSSQLILW